MPVHDCPYHCITEWNAARPGADVVEALMASLKERREKGEKLPSEELEECLEGM